MNRNPTLAGRFALTGIALAACLVAGNASALGLGRLSVQSALGENLRAEIDITSLTPEEAASFRARIATPEAFRAAGVDYNAVLPGTQAVLLRRADGRPYLRLTSNRPVQEPFVDVILELSWPTGRLVREYTMLIDPPTTMARAAEPAPAAQARIAAAPAAPAPAPAATTPAPAPRVAERRAPPPAATAAAPAAPRTGPDVAGAVPAGASGDEYRVRSGDSLSRIAARTQRAGVSLDQMLVSLFRSNPAAFIASNMNRLRAGAVLSVPSAEGARAISDPEARQVIQAQSADFGAYRQRLAGIAPTARTEAPTRQASGRVEASVDDRRTGVAATPDKLTLSKNTRGAPAEDRISKQTEKQASDQRIAELNRNVASLSQAAASAGAATPTSRTSAATPPAATAAPTIVAAAPVPTPPAATPTPPVAPSASAPSLPAPSAGPAAAAASAAVASASAPAATAAASAPRTVPAVAAAPAPARPSGFAAWMDENPLLLAAGAALVALLGGLGIYRLTQRARRDSGETSFLESRLQPDSFFGASGGQRIDTRDAAAASSMSYSLSQLDAIGDVDPVAEADVYLAYGRDLQAEEILKEAMRTTPDRTAIRTKLLEVYAKRRDTKGFELLAAQLYTLTHGQGEDWAKAQEMGALIDPDNPMYQPGGVPANLPLGADRDGEGLGASTMPQSVMSTNSKYASSFGPTTQAPPASDLDLDLDHAPAPVPSRLPELPTSYATTQSFPASPAPLDESPMTLDLSAPDFALPDLPATPAPAPSARPNPAETPMAFDLSSISLDLDLPAEPAAGNKPADAPAPAPALSSDFDLPFTDSDNPDDPISRKLELADEFRQIGDMEGARDLLQEVVAKSSGAVQARAKGMLDEIS